jgi:RNA polymerase sigma factor (sigma-70 family)
MATDRLRGALRHLHRAALRQDRAALTDGQLLDCFIQRGDEAAFEVLVQRHGPMVLGVCRRVLGNVHDAEDAFQATFLVLVRKAASVVPRAMVGNWLYGVAHNTARKARAMNTKRRQKEREAAALAARDYAVEGQELRLLLDEELARLPDRYRVPVVLCGLEGRPIKEAAVHLGWAPGTVASRLARGRALLSKRLARHGLVVSAGALAAALATDAAAAVPGPLLAALKVAAAGARHGPAGGISAKVALLSEEVLRAMWMSKVKTVVVLVLMMGLTGLGLSLLANGGTPAEGKDAQAAGSGPRRQADDDAPDDADNQREPRDAARLARDQAESRLNLKKLALAMHTYRDAHGHFPAPASYAQETGGGGMMPMGGTGAMSGAGGGGAGGSGMMPAMGGGSAMRPGGGAGTGGRGGKPGQPGGSSAGEGGAASGGGAATGMSAQMMQAMGGSGAGGAMRGMMDQMMQQQRGVSMPGLGMYPPTMTGQMMAPATEPGVYGGKALLSWRVAILPFLGPEEEQLYRQFKLGEPWDSPHNKPLLKKMPRVFAAPGDRARSMSMTPYQVFVGPHAAFEKHRALRPGDFLDGFANTVLIVEAGSAVPWTKPEDLHFAPDEPIPELGGLFSGIFNAALADGTVIAVRKNADPSLLRDAIMRDDGHVIDINELRAPTSRREVQLRQQHERLQQELARERKRLEDLRREREVLQEMTEDAASRRLHKENDQLEQELRRTHDEAERLRRDIDGLRQRQTAQPPGGARE